MVAMRRALRVGSFTLIFALLGAIVPGLVEVASARPAHNVVCRYTADIPYQFGRGAPVSGEAHITCTPTPPDVSSTTVRIWRYDTARGKYYVVAEKTATSLPPTGT